MVDVVCAQKPGVEGEEEGLELQEAGCNDADCLCDLAAKGGGPEGESGVAGIRGADEVDCGRDGGDYDPGRMLGRGMGLIAGLGLWGRKGLTRCGGRR